jgi:hypothetical protein
LRGRKLYPSMEWRHDLWGRVECINLVEHFKQFRLGWGPSYVPEYKHVPKHLRDPWFVQIKCRQDVVIYPAGGTKLSLELNHHNLLAKRIAPIPGVTCSQDGDQEKTFVFDVSLFEQVSAIVKPRRQRTMTREQRQRAIQRLSSTMTPEQRREHLAKARARRTRARQDGRNEPGCENSRKGG